MNQEKLFAIYEQVISDLLEKQYSVVDHFFEDDEVNLFKEQLLEVYEADCFKKAAIGNVFNEQIVKSIRGDFISWISDKTENNSERHFLNRIEHFSDYLNRTCFLGLQTKEFHYAVYPEGTFYKRHLDTFMNDDSRKLSLVCYLNDEDWKPDFGGELVIYKEDHDVILYPTKGRVVIFESQLLEHEVKPVVQPRYSITGWLRTRKL